MHYKPRKPFQNLHGMPSRLAKSTANPNPASSPAVKRHSIHPDFYKNTPSNNSSTPLQAPSKNGIEERYSQARKQMNTLSPLAGSTEKQRLNHAWEKRVNPKAVTAAEKQHRQIVIPSHSQAQAPDRPINQAFRGPRRSGM